MLDTMDKPTSPPATNLEEDTDYEYYVNAVLFGATVTCYAVLLFLFCYFFWKLVRSAVDHIRTCYSSHRQGLDSTVPYKGMRDDSLSSIAVIRITADNEKSKSVEQEEPVRNPFWGPLHARAQAALSVA